MKVQEKHGKVTQNMHGASRNYRYVWDVSRGQGGAPGTLLDPWWPPRCPLGLYLVPAEETPNIDLLFPFSSLYRRRCFKIGAARRSYPGTLPEGGTTSGRPSIAMDASRMCCE